MDPIENETMREFTEQLVAAILTVAEAISETKFEEPNNPTLLYEENLGYVKGLKDARNSK